MISDCRVWVKAIFFRTVFWHFFRNIPCQKPVPPVYSIFIRFQPKRRKINPKEPPKTLSQEKSWNRVFLMEKREEKPKRNLKKGLTKPKTRHQRSVKKRKRDLKSEQKKRRGAERLSEKRIKKDSLLQLDYLDILWIKPSRFWQMKLRKKCQKRVRKDNFAKTDQVFMLVPSKFRYFLATDWQHFLQYPLNKIIFV